MNNKIMFDAVVGDDTIKELGTAVELTMSPYQGECPLEPDLQLLDALVLVLRYL